MMRPLALAALLLCGGFAAAQEPPLPSPDSELRAAEAFLATQPPEAVDDINFATTYALPEVWTWKDGPVNLRKNCENALPFVLNSVAGVSANKFVERPRRVPGSKTLWWWTNQQFGHSREDVAAVARLQPYFLLPLVDGRYAGKLFRADWLVVYATDATKLDDRGVKDFPYYILQYGKGKEPKNRAEFEKAWLVDQALAAKLQEEIGTVVDKGDSGVSQHTRQLTRIRTILGYYWYTKDVKSHDFDLVKVQPRDYLEEIQAKQSDAGEYIASNKRRFQTYLLTAGTNDDFKRVEFADPTLVVDRSDANDPRVRTGKSCMVCHAYGIIPYTNAIQDGFRLGARLWANKEFEELVKGFYLSHKDGAEVKADNELFAAAVKDANGLTPEANLKAYLSVYEWYWYEKVTTEQAAVEWGVSVEQLKAQLKDATTGRLVFLFHGKAVPRDIWDSPNLGGYVQVGLLLKRMDKGAMRGAAPAEAKTVEVVTDRAPLMDQHERVVVYLPKGGRLLVVRQHDANWLVVKYGDHSGYVQRSQVK